jgi:nitroreductase
MTGMIEAIKKRYSVRTYNGKQIDPEKLQKITNYLNTLTRGPFGNSVRLQLVDMTDKDKNELKKLGTYRAIKGPRLFIAGAVSIGENAMEDYGYCLEKAILEATELELGTVWLGGFLNRSAFSERINPSKDEVIPAVTPIGYPAEKKSATDRFIRIMSGGDKRKAFSEIFFRGSFKTSLERAECGKYFEVLEAVRWAPSASNKQPWRIVMENEQNRFHFYLAEDKIYNNAIKGIKIQNIDMGIAMCHFEVAAQDLGLTGRWEFGNNRLEIKDTTYYYIASWSEQ